MPYLQVITMNPHNSILIENMDQTRLSIQFPYQLETKKWHFLY